MNDFHGCDNLGLEPTSSAPIGQPVTLDAATRIRNQALEEAALVCDQSSLQPAIAARIRALQSTLPAALQAEPSEHDIETLAAGFAVGHRNGLIRFARALLARYGAQPAASARPGKTAVFPVNILGGPMREYAPGKWENAVWPSEQPAASVEPVLRIYAEGSMRNVTEWLDGARDLPDGDHTLYAAPVAAQASGQAQDANAEPIAYSQAIEWGPRQTEQVIKVTRRPQPQYGYASALYTQAPGANADALDAAISRVRDAGVALSNAAYNLAQRAGQELTQRDADVLDRCRREWDAARDGLHAALQRTTGREGE